MEVTVRPMAESDVEAARSVQSSSFNDYDRRLGEDVPAETPEVVARQTARIRHLVTQDPGGSWVAVADGVVVGCALALRRESLWGLSLLVVEPSVQSLGVGRRLLDAALTYAGDASAGVILSSQDPRAMRAYARAGFDLHPQVRARGVIDRSVLPRLPRVKDGDASRAGWADDVDRLARGAGRGPDHEILCSFGEMFVVDDVDGRGYAYVRRDGGRITTIAATDPVTATELLWRCLATEHEGEREVDHVNAVQQWAIRVAVEARMRFLAGGPVFWRGRTPPSAFLPDGAYL